MQRTATPELSFWNWFQNNEHLLFSADNGDEPIIDTLVEQLEAVAADLTFELGPIRDGQREFVLSAGGIKSAFPAVFALAEQAPSLPRWTFVKFRPRRDALHSVSIGNISANPTDVECALLSSRNDPSLGICLFLRGCEHEGDRNWEQLGYLLLDEALGEHDVETKVSVIRILPFNSSPNAPRFPLNELAERFDAKYASRTKK